MKAVNLGNSYFHNHLKYLMASGIKTYVTSGQSDGKKPRTQKENLQNLLGVTECPDWLRA